MTGLVTKPSAQTVQLTDLRRHTLDNHLAMLLRKHEAAYKQWDRELSDANKIAIEAEIESLEQEIENTEEKLQNLHLSQNPQLRHIEWQDALPEMDFTEAVRIFDKILGNFERSGGAALFLIQDCHSLGGKWCIKRLKSKLRKKTRHFQEYPIEFLPAMPLDEGVVLARLGEYVGQEPPREEPDPEQNRLAIKEYAQAVVRKIIDSLQSGSVVFIELHCWDMRSLGDPFLPWFVTDFWLPLVRDEWPLITNKYPFVKLVTVIVANSALPEGLPSALSCTEDEFDRGKVLELPLQRWTLEEIETWLHIYSGLSAPDVGLEVEEIGQMAYAIFQAGGSGTPALIVNALMDTLDGYFR